MQCSELQRLSLQKIKIRRIILKGVRNHVEKCGNFKNNLSTNVRKLCKNVLGVVISLSADSIFTSSELVPCHYILVRG